MQVAIACTAALLWVASLFAGWPRFLPWAVLAALFWTLVGLERVEHKITLWHVFNSILLTVFTVYFVVLR